MTPDYRVRVSRRLEKDWKNGKIYYALKDREIKLPMGRVGRRRHARFR